MIKRASPSFLIGEINMWIILGGFTIVLTLVNIFTYLRGGNYRKYMVLALVTANLTSMAEIILIIKWIEKEDWTALMDTGLYIRNSLIIFILVVVIGNLLPLLLDSIKGFKEKNQ